MNLSLLQLSTKKWKKSVN